MQKAIDDFNNKLADYLKSCSDLSKAYMNEIQSLMAHGKYEDALELMEDCPNPTTKIGLTNLIKHNQKLSQEK